MFWFAVAVAPLSTILRAGSNLQPWHVCLLLIPLPASGAAVGSLYQRPWRGALIGISIMLASMILCCVLPVLVVSVLWNMLA